jgi:hypothetical protein
LPGFFGQSSIFLIPIRPFDQFTPIVFVKVHLFLGLGLEIQGGGIDAVVLVVG